MSKEIKNNTHQNKVAILEIRTRDFSLNDQFSYRWATIQTVIAIKLSPHITVLYNTFYLWAKFMRLSVKTVKWKEKGLCLDYFTLLKISILFNW